MKNKVLASLLAVCLFVGLAVPAFADYSSSVEGDPAKATMIDFYNADGNKVITELTIKNGSTENIESLVRVYEDKNTLILDHSYLDYSLEGDTLAFGINGSEVTAIDGKGSAKVIVKSTLSDKIVGTLKITAAPASTEKYATGFRFKDTAYTLPVGAGAEDFAVKVVSVPAGSKFTDTQKNAIDNLVVPAIQDVTSYVNAPFATCVADAVKTTAGAVASTASFFVTGLKQNEEVVITTVLGAAKASVVATSAKNDTTGITTITLTISDTATITNTFTMSMLQTALRSKSSSAVISAGGPNGESPAVNVTVNQFKVVAAGSLTCGDAKLDSSSIELSSDDNDATRVYTIKGTNTQGAAKDLIPGAKTRLNVKTTTFVDGNTLTNRTVDAITYIENVKAVPALKIGGPASITIEVGEVYNTADTVKFGPSNANVGKAFNIYNDFSNSNSDANDYAAIETNGKKIMGVKVGTNKVIAALNNNTETATITVNVVAKGTKPATPDATTAVLSFSIANTKVGGSFNIVVKNAADKTIKYGTADSTIATIDASGKVTGVKEGTAKVYAEVDGVKLYCTVNVAGVATDKPTDKPSDVPATGVAVLAPLF